MREKMVFLGGRVGPVMEVWTLPLAVEYLPLFLPKWTCYSTLLSRKIRPLNLSLSGCLCLCVWVQYARLCEVEVGPPRWMRELLIQAVKYWHRMDERHTDLHLRMTDEMLELILPQIYPLSRLSTVTPEDVRRDYPLRRPIDRICDVLVHGYFVPEYREDEGSWLEVRVSDIPKAGRGLFVKAGKVFFQDDVITNIAYHHTGYKTPPESAQCPIKLGRLYYVAKDYGELLEAWLNGQKVGVGGMINRPRSVEGANCKLKFSPRTLEVKVVAKCEIRGPKELYALYKLG